MPTELVVLDFDDTLYRSPGPTRPDPTWWFQPYSLDSVQAGPGYDPRWVLPVVLEARRAINRPSTMTVVLTARVSSSGMRKQVKRILGLTGLQFDAVQLMPLAPPVSIPLYKAGAVGAWLNRHPDIRSVVFYDDQERNLEAVGELVSRRGCRYTPIKT